MAPAYFRPLRSNRGPQGGEARTDQVEQRQVDMSNATVAGDVRSRNDTPLMFALVDHEHAYQEIIQVLKPSTREVKTRLVAFVDTSNFISFFFLRSL